LPFCTGVRGGEPLVELLLPKSGGVAELGCPGGPRVAGVGLGGGAPHLQVGDQLGRHESVLLGRPGRRLICGGEADLVGELSNPVGSGVQVWSPVGVGGDAVGNAGQPRQRTVSTTGRAGVVQTPVQHGGSVISADEFFDVVRGTQLFVRVGTVHGEEEQVGTQGRPCRLVG